MLVYVVNVDRTYASADEVEKWVNNDFRDDLSWRSINENIGVFDQYEKAEKKALEMLKRDSRIYKVKEVDENIFVNRIHIGNKYRLGNIRYKYFNKYYVVYYEIHEFEVQ